MQKRSTMMDLSVVADLNTRCGGMDSLILSGPTVYSFTAFEISTSLRHQILHRAVGNRPWARYGRFSHQRRVGDR